ncbi:MAG: mannonate dehydratase [Balneolaceae bacterium]
MLDEEHFAFARQAGATHIVAHLTDYFNKGDHEDTTDQPVGNTKMGWGIAQEKKIWSYEMLISLKNRIAKYDLKLEALENISPAFWHDILLDGPLCDVQIEDIKKLVQNMGKAGIPILGYYFSLAGIAGRIRGPFARGGAVAVGMDGEPEVVETPIPRGMVWNMIYDPSLIKSGEVLETISQQELNRRHQYFLNEILPVAEESGVKLAMHPDDPPLKEIRKQPRLGYHPDHYKEIMKTSQNPNHMMELCLGTIAEMEGGDIYETVEHFAARNEIGYIHFRNVRNKVPYYKETFVDEGDIDMARIVRILREHDYQGMIVPDHAPQMSCDAPWHAGMAFSMGYIKALLQIS